MSKNLDLLKQEFFDVSHEGILKYLIPVLEDLEKQITELEKHTQEFLNYREISKLQIKLKELEEKIKKLEQAQTYFPCHSDNKYIFEHFTDYCIGGVDNIKIEKIESPESNFIAYDLTKLEKGDD